MMVTCDLCSATSEAGWGDTPLCLSCQEREDASLVCEEHQRTFVDKCPLDHELDYDATSSCVDCGEIVPTVRTGQGWRDLPPCPASTSQLYPGHRVSNDAFRAAGGKP